MFIFIVDDIFNTRWRLKHLLAINCIVCEKNLEIEWIHKTKDWNRMKTVRGRFKYMIKNDVCYNKLNILYNKPIARSMTIEVFIWIVWG